MIQNEISHVNGVPNGVKKQVNGDSAEGRYWDKRYVPNQDETFVVSPARPSPHNQITLNLDLTPGNRKPRSATRSSFGTRMFSTGRSTALS